MAKITIGFALCGSFCSFSKAIPQIEKLIQKGHTVIPIMSHNAYSTDTRFGKAADFNKDIEQITGKKIIHTITGAEPIGPQKMFDLLIIAPCTGNTLGKLAASITDTSVTMSVKSHLRILRPVLIAISTNDGLGASAQNVGKLLNTKNIFFVPFKQDDCINKPNSLVSDFNLIEMCIEKAMNREQYQPIISP